MAREPCHSLGAPGAQPEGPHGQLTAKAEHSETTFRQADNAQMSRTENYRHSQSQSITRRPQEGHLTTCLCPGAGGPGWPTEQHAQSHTSILEHRAPCYIPSEHLLGMQR